MIDIKNIQGNIIFSTPINRGGLYRKKLMSEDYISLKFSVSSPIHFDRGYHTEYNGKRFEVVDLSYPQYNTSSGGYDYELRLDAYYWKWKNKNLYYDRQNNSEVSWKLTRTPDAHLSIVCSNLAALGYTYNGAPFTFVIDVSVDMSAKLIEYNDINIIDALTLIAQTWEAEWWVEDNVIHLGKCEYNTAIDFELGHNVQSMSRSESNDNFATRVYAFGSTRNLPVNYRNNQGIVVEGIVQKRLMLPAGTSCIDAYPNMPQEQAVEGIVVFDDVYPRRVGTMSGVATKEYTDTIENEDGSTTEEKWNAYRFKDTGLTFSKEYIIPGQELRIVFTSGALNGMDFAVTFNPDGKGEADPDAQLWEIVRSEDYGRDLPDGSLKPVNGDTYILYGFDTSFVSSTYLPAAEQELKQRAEQYVEKSKEDPSVYDCPMNVVDMTLGDIDLNVGDRVRLLNPAYFDGNGRQSRIYGFEKHLDGSQITYTVGNTSKYSRLAQVENEVKEIVYQGNAYSGSGGGGVYVIGRYDKTAATDRNVFSSTRTLQEIQARALSKLFADIAAGHITFKDGFTAEAFATVYKGIVKEYLSSEVFIPGLLGEGFKIYKDNGKWTAEFDNVIVRQAMTIYELIISKVRSVNGGLAVSPGNGRIKSVAKTNSESSTNQRVTGIVVNSVNVPTSLTWVGASVGNTVYVYGENLNLNGIVLVDWSGNTATLSSLVNVRTETSGYIDATFHTRFNIYAVVVDGVVIWNLIGYVPASYYVLGIEGDMQFVTGDLVRCDVFAANQKKHYWVEVKQVTGDSILCLASDFGTAVPAVGDDLVQFGNTVNKNRQGIVYITASEDGKPRVQVLDGVNSTNLTGKSKAILGCLDGITDTAFPADRQPSGYGLYAENAFLKGIFLLRSGKTVESEIGDAADSAQQAAIIAAAADAAQKVKVAKDAADAAQSAADKAQGDATSAKTRLDNWASDSVISPSEKLALRTEQTNIRAEKNELVAEAGKYGVSTTAYVNAFNPYDSDLTYHTTATPENITVLSTFATRQAAYYSARTALLEAIAAKTKQLADDAMSAAGSAATAAADAQSAAASAIQAAGKAQGDVSDLGFYVDGAFKDGVIDSAEAKAIEKYLNTLNETMSQVEATYNKIYVNEYLDGNARTNLYNAIISLQSARDNLRLSINNAIADGKTTQPEKADVDSKFSTFNARLKDFQGAVEDANKAIQAGSIGSIQVGGRNLLLNSNKGVTGWGYAVQNGTHQYTEVNELNVRAAKSTTTVVSTGWHVLTHTILRGNLTNNTEYTFSVDVYCDFATNMGVSIRQTSALLPLIDFGGVEIPAKQWKKVVLTAVSNNETGIGQVLYITGFNQIGSVIFANLKIERGNKPTDWTEAPEDAEARVKSAQDAADGAKTAANTANSLLADIANDNKFTASEKQETKKEWDGIVSEYSKNVAQANTFGVSTSAYTNAYNPLSSYITPLLSNLAVTSDIAGTTFRATFKAYYDARTDLLNAIAIKAKQLADEAINLRVTTSVFDQQMTAIAGEISSKVSSNTFDSFKEDTKTSLQELTPDKIKMTVKQQTTDIAAVLSAIGRGKMLHRDPTFNTGNNGISVYNNAGNGTVTHARVSGIAGNPNDSGFAIRITTSGDASPGHGGFAFCDPTRANAVFVTRIIAAIPVGSVILWASNATGDGRKWEWLTSQDGVGTWKEYIFKLACGGSGSFSTTNYFYLNGGSNPTWYLAFATSYDVTGVDDIPTTETIKSEFKQTATGFSLFGQEISLTGKVTFSMFALDAKNTIDGKATTGYVDSAKDSAISAASGDATTKANNATTNARNNIAARLGYGDYATMEAKANAGQTIIEGGYIRSSLIQADAVFASKIAAVDITTSRLTVNDGAKIGKFSIYDGGLTNTGTFNETIYVNQSCLYLKDGYLSLAFVDPDVGGSRGLREKFIRLRGTSDFTVPTCSIETNTTSSYFTSKVRALSLKASAGGGAEAIAMEILSGYITGLCVKVRRVSSTTYLYHDDVWVTCTNSATATIYLPSSPQVGKVIYVSRQNTTVTVSGYGKSIMCGGTYSTVNITSKGDVMPFIYDGEYWITGWLNHW